MEPGLSRSQGSNTNPATLLANSFRRHSSDQFFDFIIWLFAMILERHVLDLTRNFPKPVRIKKKSEGMETHPVKSKEWKRKPKAEGKRK